MRIFMTGGTGYTGSYVVRHLLADGHEVTLLTRNAASVACPGSVKVVGGSVENVQLVATSLAGHDVCIHHAVVWDDKPTELELKDTRASAALFESAAKAGVQRLIYTSSVAVHRPFRGTMSEESPISPADYYGATKASGEMFLSAVAQQFGLPWSVVRLGPVAGAPLVDKGPFKSHSKFHELIAAALSGEDLVVARGDGRQFIAVRDVGSVYSAILSTGRQGIFLAMARQPTTWESVARVIVKECSSNSRVVIEANTIEAFSFDVSKLERELGLSLDADDAIEDHVRHLLA